MVILNQVRQRSYDFCPIDRRGMEAVSFDLEFYSSESLGKKSPLFGPKHRIVG